VNKLHQLLKEALTVSVIVLACEIKRLGDVGSAESFEESFANLFARERRSHSEVVCDCEAVVVPGKLGESQGVEDFIREGRNERWFGEVLKCSLVESVIAGR
jgi:hypothetical protein